MRIDTVFAVGDLVHERRIALGWPEPQAPVGARHRGTPGSASQPTVPEPRRF